MRALVWKTIPVLPVLATGMLLCSSPSMAEDAGAASLRDQRHLFVKAESYLARGQISAFRRIEPRLKDYPLYPYLTYTLLKRDLRKADPAAITAYINGQGNSPLAEKLRYRWLTQLAHEKKWPELVANFTRVTDKGLQCQYAQGLFEVGEKSAAHALSRSLWLTGASLPKACDGPMKKWRDEGGLNLEHIWLRIQLAMNSGNTRLASHLAKDYLGKEDQGWVEIWRKLRRHPDKILELHQKHVGQDIEALRWIMADGISRMASSDPIKAAQYWKLLQGEYSFTEATRQRLERRLALKLLQTGGEEARAWISALKLPQETPALITVYILSAMRDQDWDTAMEWLSRLDHQDQNSERWQYWRARTLEALGHMEEARSQYANISQQRTFYGFLAADRAGLGYQLDNRPLDYSKDDLSSLDKITAIARARELYNLGRVVAARREWSFALQQMSRQQILKAAKLAHDWGWYDRAIISLAEAEYWDDLDMRFPLAHRTLVLDQAKRQGVNPAWAYAIIRQESAFTADARSHAGAMGLMQLLPRTARQVARSMNLRTPRHSDLLNIGTNVKLGVSYLRKVQHRFKGNMVLATAAYNAGGLRVKEWLPNNGVVPADLWVEMVPFPETRDYLQRVFSYMVIYEQRLGQSPTTMLERMLPVSGPENKDKLTLTDDDPAAGTDSDPSPNPDTEQTTEADTEAEPSEPLAAGL